VCWPATSTAKARRCWCCTAARACPVSIVDGLVADLLPAYRVATFQQRGIEPSTTEGVFTTTRRVADVGAVLDHLRLGTGPTSWGARGVAILCSGARHRCRIGCWGYRPSTRSVPSGDGGNAEIEASWSRHRAGG
jgi:hypothetical protein